MATGRTVDDRARRAERPIPPKLQALVDRASKVAAIALERVVANAANPREYPLPQDPKCAERLLKQKFERLPPARKKAILDTVTPRAREPRAARASRLGELADVDLASPRSVSEQVKAITLPSALRLDSRDLAAIVEYSRDRFLPNVITPGGSGPSQAQGAIARNLALRVKRAQCLDETRGEAGGDEMAIFAVVVDQFGSTRDSDAIRLGTFRSGTAFDYPDGLLERFNGIDLGSFPKAFTAVPVLLELDRSDNDANLDTDALAISGVVLAALGAIETVLLSLLATPLALVALIVAILGGVMFALALMFGDEFFKADQGFGVVINSNALVQPAGGVQTFQYNGHGGSYAVTLAFEVEP